MGLLNYDIHVYYVGRHTYWSNIELDLKNVVQLADDIAHTPHNKRQGGENVHNVIEVFLKTIHKEEL